MFLYPSSAKFQPKVELLQETFITLVLYLLFHQLCVAYIASTWVSAIQLPLSSAGGRRVGQRVRVVDVEAQADILSVVGLSDTAGLVGGEVTDQKVGSSEAGVRNDGSRVGKGAQDGKSTDDSLKSEHACYCLLIDVLNNDWCSGEWDNVLIDKEWR